MSSRITTFEQYQATYKHSVENPEEFWAEIASEFLWRKKWDKVLEWNFTEPNVQWFIGGKLNITENCLDRHLAERGNQPAIIWEPNNPNESGRTLTYNELHEQVCLFATVLKNNGAKKGDRICIYMPMVPELAIAVLACARIGAIHSVVFGGFSFQSLSDRIHDATCNIVITADGAFRGAKDIPLKSVVDEALLTCPSVKKVIVLKRTNAELLMQSGRDVWWEDEMNKLNLQGFENLEGLKAEEMDSEDKLFILYTSGSTGKPKGVVHTCGGYMVYTKYTFENVFQYNHPTLTLPKKEGNMSGERKNFGYYKTDSQMFKVLQDKAVGMRNNPTQAENALWQSLRKNSTEHHFRRQHIIGNFIVDFVCLEKSLVIEVDGDIHDYQKEEDEQRTKFLEEKGFEVIRFRNEEVIGNIDGVVKQISEKLITKLSYKNTAHNTQHSAQTPLPLGEGQGGEVYWCTADVGWITGHSYLVYGPLLAGATTLMFEGIPTYPDAGRFWQIIDKYKVNIFYTAPTAIRSLQAMGEDFVRPYSLKSLRVLGTVGEPINVEAWEWYHKNIGKEKCPIVDTWWQTETGGIMISPLAGITKTKPSFATLPLPGVQPVLLDEKGNELLGNNVEGMLCIKFPWPSIIRTTYGNHERCKQTYFASFKNYYFTGDGCKRNEDGYYRITGRVDDVIKVSGHLLGTAEIENAINQHPDIVESAVVGFPHDIKGWGIYAFVILTPPRKGGEYEKSEEELKKEIVATVVKFMGAIAKPDKIQVVKGLPKTRSGKIMRRILRKIAEGDVSNLGDISTLLDPAVVEEIKNGAV